MAPGVYGRLARPVKAVPFNTLFAKMVVHGHVKGRVFADDAREPRTFYILHPYGMTLLAGRRDNGEFNEWLRGRLLGARDRCGPEYIQAHPQEWGDVIKELAGPSYHPLGSVASADRKVTEDARINFRFGGVAGMPGNRDVTIVRTDETIYNDMPGAVIPRHFWDSWSDFEKNGIGFTALIGGEPASTAFASFVIEENGRRCLELGVETAPGFQGRGLAKQVCARLIGHCLENGYEPVWSCRLSNISSHRLALSLGFEEELRVGYWIVG